MPAHRTSAEAVERRRKRALDTDSKARTAIGSRLRRKRESLYLSRADAAYVAGLSAAALVRYESGERTPSATALLRLALAYECSADHLLGIGLER